MAELLYDFDRTAPVQTEDIVTTPGVSVIIVNWNTRDMLLELLGSLLSPLPVGSGPLEVIVVDNFSRDGSADAVRAAFPQVKVLAQEENRGFAGGVNPGVEAASQPFVLLLNSDARTSPASIAEAASYLEQHPGVGVLGPRMLNPDGSHQSSCWRDPSLLWIALSAFGLNRMALFASERYYGRPFSSPQAVDCVAGSAMLIRKDLFIQLGGLDEEYFMYFEETDFCLRVRQRGYEVHHAPVGRFVHERGTTAKSVRLRTFLDFRRSQILFHHKHGGPLAALGARGLLALSAAVRVPPLFAISTLGGPSKNQARTKLMLHCKGLRWLLNPRLGLIPEVDRTQ